MSINWESKLDNSQREFLSAIGEYGDFLPTRYNVVQRVLADHQYDELVKAQSLISLSKLAVICQMKIYDHDDGPEGDRKQKALRRHWYAYYKKDIAQPLHQLVSDKEFNGTQWAGRMSETYAFLVDECQVTYKDLWVDDASRMMEKFYERLFTGFNVIVAVEKDSLFSDFLAASKALGAPSVLSGKGKCSKAAIEKLLREHFGWREDWSPFSEENPLIILHLSDHDYDGEQVIGPTFAEQARRYTSHILEARIGVNPEQVDDWQTSWYETKVNDEGYIQWSNHKALFLAECQECHHQWPVVGIGQFDDDGWMTAHKCPECDGESRTLLIKVGKDIQDAPHGFEVEALPTRKYYRLIAEALLSVVPFELILTKLREECRADAYNAASQIKSSILSENESYQKLLLEFERLDGIKDAFESRIHDSLVEMAEPHINDWIDLGNDPDPEQYIGWVESASSYTGPWRPFHESDRTDKLIEYLVEEAKEAIDGFKSEQIEW